MAEDIDVLILVQENCHFSRDAKALLARLAREYPLRIRTLDMRTPQGEWFALEARVLFPPGILLQGIPLCSGRPSEGKLRRGIERLLAEDSTEFRLRGAIEGILAEDPEPGERTVAGVARALTSCQREPWQQNGLAPQQYDRGIDGGEVSVTT